MTIRIAALGTVIALEIEDVSLQRLVGRALEDLDRATERDVPAAQVLVEGDGPWRVRSPAYAVTATCPEQALTRTLTAVNLSVLAETPLLAFHAAVVTRHGAALVLPAASGTGKSTLTACLLRQGWAYVSDEALGLDWEAGPPVTYARPMALSAWSCAATDQPVGIQAENERLVRTADLGADVDHNPGPVRLVALLERAARSPGPSIVAVDRNDGLVELMQRGFTHHRDGGLALRRAVRVLEASDVVRVRLGDPAAAAAQLTALTGTW